LIGCRNKSVHWSKFAYHSYLILQLCGFNLRLIFASGASQPHQSTAGLRPLDWCPALAISVILHAAVAAAAWVVLPAPKTDPPARQARPIQVSLGVSVSRDAASLGVGQVADATPAEADAKPSPDAEPSPPQALEPAPAVSMNDQAISLAKASPLEVISVPTGELAEEQRQPLPPWVADRARLTRLPEPERATHSAVSGSPASETTVSEPLPESSEATRPAPGSDSADEEARRGIAAEYAGRIQALLADHRRYPRRARQLGQQGEARLFFAVDRDGRLVESRIEQSSGHHVLDREVLAMVERAQPLPPIPEPLARGRLELVVPVQFQLR